jgi:hypothetical protein
MAPARGVPDKQAYVRVRASTPPPHTHTHTHTHTLCLRSVISNNISANKVLQFMRMNVSYPKSLFCIQLSQIAYLLVTCYVYKTSHKH